MYYIDACKFGAFSEYIEIYFPNTQTHTFPGLSIGPEGSVGGSVTKGTKQNKVCIEWFYTCIYLQMIIYCYL